MRFLIKSAVLSLFVLNLVACGGHGYEGEYSLQGNTGNDAMDSALSSQGAAYQLIIGDDYIEMMGQRRKLDSIYVDSRNGGDYLVFELEGDSQAFKIIDDNRLVSPGMEDKAYWVRK